MFARVDLNRPGGGSEGLEDVSSLVPRHVRKKVRYRTCLLSYKVGAVTPVPRGVAPVLTNLPNLSGSISGWASENCAVHFVMGPISRCPL